MNIADLFDLKGKTAIVTGGARGLGAQIAEIYGKAGANLVICSRDKAACDQMVDKLSTKGVKALAIQWQCDFTSQEDVKKVVEETIEHFDKIDILVNNSGASWAAPVEEMPLKAWQKVMDVNVTGTFLMSQEVGKVI